MRRSVRIYSVLGAITATLAIISCSPVDEEMEDTPPQEDVAEVSLPLGAPPAGACPGVPKDASGWPIDAGQLAQCCGLTVPANTTVKYCTPPAGDTTTCATTIQTCSYLGGCDAEVCVYKANCGTYPTCDCTLPHEFEHAQVWQDICDSGICDGAPGNDCACYHCVNNACENWEHAEIYGNECDKPGCDRAPVNPCRQETSHCQDLEPNQYACAGGAVTGTCSGSFQPECDCGDDHEMTCEDLDCPYGNDICVQEQNSIGDSTCGCRGTCENDEQCNNSCLSNAATCDPNDDRCCAGCSCGEVPGFGFICGGNQCTGNDLPETGGKCCPALVVLGDQDSGNICIPQCTDVPYIAINDDPNCCRCCNGGTKSSNICVCNPPTTTSVGVSASSSSASSGSGGSGGSGGAGGSGATSTSNTGTGGATTSVTGSSVSGGSGGG